MHARDPQTRWWPRRGLATLALVLLLAACGAPTVSTGGVSLAEPTATATAIPPTATPIRPTATIPPTVAPTATRPPSSPTVARATAVPGGYVADWSTWEAGLDDKNQYRRTYDQAANAYRVAVLEDDREWSFYAPEAKRFQNFVLEVDAAAVTGPDTLGYGLVFRRQARQEGKAASERYVFYVTPQGRFKFFQVTPENTQRVLRTLDAPSQSGVIKVGKETNHLTVTCQGATIALAINGTEVFRVTNAAITASGEIGIFASSPVGATDAEVVFRNLQLRPAP